MSRDAPATGTTIAERYLVGVVLGSGGMGVVYEAVQLDLGRTVAIKLLSEPSHPADAARFAREARILAQLAHPNVVPVFDFGTEDGRAYVVMERLYGETLASAIHGGPLAPDRVVEIFSRVLDALATVHATGIVHRDIKPANIFLTDHGVKLLDFGIAFTDDGAGRLTTTGTIMGTPAYLAPEQVLGRTVDPRSDLYSLGVSMFEALAGTKPFPKLSSTELIVEIVNGRSARLSTLRPALPEPLVRVVERAMALDPGARFSSAAAMMAALGERSPAGPRTVPMPRPPRSPRWLPAGIGFVVVVVVGLFAVGVALLASRTARLPDVAPSATPSTDTNAEPVPPTSATVNPDATAVDEGGAKSIVPRVSRDCRCSPDRSRADVAPLCTEPIVPNCDCRGPGRRLLCPKSSFDERGACSIHVGDLHAYSAAGRKNGDACQGFEPHVDTVVSGVLDCSYCYGIEHLARVEGATCRGISRTASAPTLEPGVWVCRGDPPRK